MMRYFLGFLTFTFCLLILASRPQAHPHSWIDLETTLLFNDQGQVTGLWQGWLFDDFYSAFTLDGMKPDENGKYDQKALRKLAATNLKNLSEYSYFTFIEADGKTQPLQEVSAYKTYIQGNRLWMEFSVMLEKPLNPRDIKLEYAVYDPTYYVEILHAVQGDPIQLTGTGAMGCGYRLKKPKPPEEMSLMAAALDQNETAGDGIGVYFAEHVEISCQ